MATDQLIGFRILIDGNRIYYGSRGFEERVDHGFAIAKSFAQHVNASEHLVLASPDPVPCLQVCLYFAKNKQLAPTVEANTAMTRAIAKRLKQENFLIDFAAGEHGMLLRVVINLYTTESTVVRLTETVQRLGLEIAERGI